MVRNYGNMRAGLVFSQEMVCQKCSPTGCSKCRASDILRKNFAGFSGANSRKNRPISRDFRGKKSKFAEQSADFGRFSREKSQNSQKNRPNLGKSQISKDFQGQILRKIGRFHGKFPGETSPRNNQ